LPDACFSSCHDTTSKIIAHQMPLLLRLNSDNGWKLTTQTPFPPEGFFGFAGHMGLVGRCSGKLNSNSAAFRNWFRFEAAAAAVDLDGISHHSLRRTAARWSNGSLSS
jgi:hypothetical protein